MNCIQINNCSFHLPAPLDGPVEVRHLRIHVHQKVPSLRSEPLQDVAPPCFPASSSHPTVAHLRTTTRMASSLRHSQAYILHCRYIDSLISTDSTTLTVTVFTWRRCCCRLFLAPLASVPVTVTDHRDSHNHHHRLDSLAYTVTHM
jgi:hypothetical protein